jgi:nitroreductase
MLKELVFGCRSYRRFYQEHTIDEETLRGLVELARLSASGHNLQPLKFILSWESASNALIFPHLGWAGYLKDWPGPEEGERPSAYVVVLGDTAISKSFGYDPGIAAQTIMLGARDRGLGGCMIGTIQRETLGQALNVPERCEILLVLALGKPKETVVVDPVGSEGDIKYWRDVDGVHHVPKRSLDEIILR